MNKSTFLKNKNGDFFSFCERMRKLDLVYFTGNVCTF